MRRIAIVVTILILSVLLIFNICSMLNISFFHFRIYKIASGSMRPILNVGEVILIKDNLDYKKGDIITYKRNNHYITHRIIQINEDEIITKGDNNNTNDDSILKEDVIGKVVLKLKVMGFLYFLLNKPFTWLLAFMIGIVIILLLPTYKRIKDRIIDNEII